MMVKVKSVLLILVLLRVFCCEGCWKEEREALLALNSRLGHYLSWDDTNCCDWEGVECNTTTRKVTGLDLFAKRDFTLGPWYLNYYDFIVFNDLRSLNLSFNNIAGCATNDQGLENLQVLDLSYNNLNNAASILSCLDGLSLIKSLYLYSNSFNATSLLSVLDTLSSKLLNLEVLDISANYLSNDILPFLGGFTSLNKLDMSQIGLTSDLYIQGLGSKLVNLEALHMSGNNFSDCDIGTALIGFPSLRSLNLGFSEMTPRSILNISKLRSLEILDLAWNNLNESILENDGYAWPTDLQVLRLYFNSFSNNFLSSLRELESLKFLNLSCNNLKESLNISGLSALTNLQILDLSYNEISHFVLHQEWSKLKKLEELDLSYNGFVGPLPLSFINMTSLMKLELSHNHFTGNFGSNLASLTSLEYFGFTENQFEVPISFKPFANHSNLKFIYGEGNRIILDSQPSLQTWIPKFQLQVLSLSSTTITDSIPLPKFLLYQFNLTSLDFTSCNLEGEFPNWLLENNTKMTELVVTNCSFTGTFKPPLHPLPNMMRIDVSDNFITGTHIPSKNTSSIFPNLQFLNMSINDIQGSISPEFGQMKLLDTLDLSGNHLSGEIPLNISGERSLLRFLRLSNNKLVGPMFPTLTTLKYLELLYLDGNRFSGSIPSGFLNSSLLALDISNNHFSGKLPNVVGNLSDLGALFMSNNHLEGSIPAGLVKLESLVYLDISENNFTGQVPSLVNSTVNFFHVSNNRLTGLSKRMCTETWYCDLWILDLRYNEITSNIHSLVQDLSYGNAGLGILLLKGNHFSGQIPKQICQWTELTILDLSHNNLSGPIPRCFGTIPFEDQDPPTPFKYAGYDISEIPYVHEKANFTTKKISYTYAANIRFYMTGIDLSFNKLIGSIPSELGNLTKIRALNLSYNYLTGKIPATFSGLTQLESLDLSFNKLSSKIPSQLNELTSLEVFSVAHNNLSGETPERKGQFITFDESSYEGNPFLCGPPLVKSCHPPPPAILPNGSYSDEDSGGLVDMYVFCVSFAVSYTLVLLVIAAVLYINPYWRRAWFYYLELVTMNCYYFIEDNLPKLTNRGN